MMRFSTISLLAALNCFSDAFLNVEPNRFHHVVSQRLQQVSISLNEATTDTDEYDDWYDDFDPSEYEQYDNDASMSSSGHDYTRDTSRDQSRVDLPAINRLISERLECRKTGRFEEADAIRDDLLNNHGVLVYDKDRTWRSGASSRGSGGKWIKDKQRGDRGRPPARDFGPNGHDYRLADDAGPNASTFSEQEIHELLAQRLECKLNRRYDEADAIQYSLNEAGVYVNDGSKHWRADGQPFQAFLPRRYDQSPSSLDSDYAEDIQELVDQRATAKAERLFKRADEIRDTLREEYDVVLDDKKRQWSVGGSFGYENRNKRSFSSFGISPDSERPPDFDEVQRLVEVRDAARADRDFATADQIRDDLMERNIFINDRLRQWSLGSFQRALDRPREYSMVPGSEEPEDADDIQRLVELRSSARGERKFEEADSIRDELLRRGVVINDRIRQWSLGEVQRGQSQTKGFNSPFTRRGGGELTKEDEERVLSLLEKRDRCKRDRHFKSADSIRDQLRDEFLVGVDDRNREWHVVTAGYVMSAVSPTIAGEVQELIQARIDERAKAKLEQDYDSADMIRDELMKDHNVSIDDRTKEWSIRNDESDQGRIESDDNDTTIVIDESTGEEGSDHEDLMALTVPALKEKLRAAGLPVSGRKSELIERLMG